MLPQLQAERQSRAIEAAGVPYMSARDRADVMNGLRKRIAAGDHTDAVAPTVRDLARIGIAVETVGADGLPVDAGMQRDSTEGDT